MDYGRSGAQSATGLTALGDCYASTFHFPLNSISAIAIGVINIIIIVGIFIILIIVIIIISSLLSVHFSLPPYASHRHRLHHRYCYRCHYWQQQHSTSIIIMVQSIIMATDLLFELIEDHVIIITTTMVIMAIIMIILLSRWLLAMASLQMTGVSLNPQTTPYKSS